MNEFNRCELCDEYINDEAQETVIKAHSGFKPVHKGCVHQLMTALWDELEMRVKYNIPLSAPYDNAHIANPVVRKSLGLDSLQWDRALTAASLLTGGQDEIDLEDVVSRLDYAMKQRSK